VGPFYRILKSCLSPSVVYRVSNNNLFRNNKCTIASRLCCILVVLENSRWNTVIWCIKKCAFTLFVNDYKLKYFDTTLWALLPKPFSNRMAGRALRLWLFDWNSKAIQRSIRANVWHRNRGAMLTTIIHWHMSSF